jgi:transposase
VPLVKIDDTMTRPEEPLAPTPVGTIDIALTNGLRMTIPVSLAPSHLAALLAVLDPR